MNTWIKRTEREPSASEFPCRAGYYSRGTQDWYEYTSNSSADLGSYTHWRSIKVDPPAWEMTQRERDEAMISAMCSSLQPRAEERAWMHKAAMDAIYAERREVAKIAEAAFGKDWGIDDGYSGRAECWKAIRARCDEQGQGK